MCAQTEYMQAASSCAFGQICLTAVQQKRWQQPGHCPRYLILVNGVSEMSSTCAPLACYAGKKS